ncbi:MAG: pilin [Candidatus Campbellbacteria bacterium]|nr:pilin [Candidatus Campbellbacteria bacterium]
MTQEQKRKTVAFGLSLAVVLVPLVSFAAIVPCGGPPPQTACTFNDLVLLVNNVINFLLYTVALPISAALFAWAGILYLTAAGDMGKISKAHEIFKNVFFGLIIALAGFLIIDLITNVLTGRGWSANPFRQP